MYCFVTPVYNAQPWIAKSIRSMQSQKFADFRAVIMDANSTDGTVAAAMAQIGEDSRFELCESGSRACPLENTVNGIKRVSQNPEDIIVIVDGDDWLKHDRVLNQLEEVYASGDVWLTYGSHQDFKNTWKHQLGLKVKRGIAREYPQCVQTARLFRYHRFLASHLRTYKRFLWDAIDDRDLRQENGEYYSASGDFAAMIPMLEMAGAERIRYIKELLYVYNCSNPGSMHKEKKSHEAQTLNHIRVVRSDCYPLYVDRIPK